MKKDKNNKKKKKKPSKMKILYFETYHNHQRNVYFNNFYSVCHGYLTQSLRVLIDIAPYDGSTSSGWL